MPIYARFGIPYAWLIDPMAPTLDAYALEAGEWQEIGRFGDGQQVAIAPFDAVTIDLAGLWVPSE